MNQCGKLVIQRAVLRSGFLSRLLGREVPPLPHRGYYATAEPYGDGPPPDDDPNDNDVTYRSGTRNPDYAEWDRRLAQVDDATTNQRPHQCWFQPSYWRARRKRWWVVRVVAAMLALFFILFAWLAITAPLSKSLEPIAAPQITLLAADGTPIARNGAIVGEPVDVGTLPPHVIDAFLSIEDRRFYEHWGVDPRGLGRAVWSNVSGGAVQGGSTITQQLAKFTFLTPERSMTRKAREMLIAFWLEGWLTKDEILERYLSNAYFGDNVYGLRAASLHYFYRRPENLTTEQAAMLAGLVQAPSRLNPAKHYARAEARMRVVAGAMAANGKLTATDADALAAPALDMRRDTSVPTGTYFADWALPAARELAEAGYAKRTLTTTLDTRLQGAARAAIGRARIGDAQVALVAMRQNGEVVAMVGGRDYATSAYNRATMARRQPGSTFKLFVYLAALEAGMKPTDRIENSAFENGSYRPRNAKDSYSDSLSLEEAFAKSSNVAAVRLFTRLGDDAVIAQARRLGIRSPLGEGDPSLALGTSGVTLLELTSAYAGIAANRFPVVPHAFPTDEPGWFDWIWDGAESLSYSKHSEMEQLLRAAINAGTGRAAMLRTANFGKTGTTQDNRDALFIGYAGDLVVGVWIGNDDNSPLEGISGGGAPARIWRDFMQQARGERIAPQRPRATPTVAPEIDEADIDAIVLDENGNAIGFDDDGVVVTTRIDGVPVDVRIGEDITVEPRDEGGP